MPLYVELDLGSTSSVVLWGDDPGDGIGQLQDTDRFFRCGSPMGLEYYL